jgi:hypothetical protein
MKKKTSRRESVDVTETVRQIGNKVFPESGRNSYQHVELSGSPEESLQLVWPPVGSQGVVIDTEELDSLYECDFQNIDRGRQLESGGIFVEIVKEDALPIRYTVVDKS